MRTVELKCDRCGTAENVTIPGVQQSNWQTMRRTETDADVRREERRVGGPIDLCPRCCEELAGWFASRSMADSGLTPDICHIGNGKWAAMHDIAAGDVVWVEKPCEHPNERSDDAR